MSANSFVARQREWERREKIEAKRSDREQRRREKRLAAVEAAPPCNVTRRRVAELQALLEEPQS